MDEFQGGTSGGEQPSGIAPGGAPSGYGEQGGGNVPSTPQGGGVPSSGAAQGSPTQGDQLYDVKYRGKTLKVGLQELLNGYSRHADYTQRTQELGRREGEWTSRLGQYERAIQELRGVLTDRNRLAQILQQMPPGEGGDNQGDEILTRSQVEEMRQKWFEEFETQQTHKMQAHQYQAQVNHLKGKFLGDLKGVYDSAAQQYPMLKKLPLFNELRLKVGTYEPQSIADAKALLANEIRELARENGWEAGGAPQQVSQNGYLAQRATPSVPGIEPPGGGAVMPPEGPRFSNLRDPGLKSAVLGDIEQMIRNSLNS